MLKYSSTAALLIQTLPARYALLSPSTSFQAFFDFTDFELSSTAMFYNDLMRFPTKKLNYGMQC